MKTLTQHNEGVTRSIKEAKAKEHLSGVSCPDCGAEMEYPDPYCLLASNPPKKRVKCPQCGHDGYKVIG